MDVEVNNGGRVSFVKGSFVRIIEVDGSLSSTKYIIDIERSDRRGSVVLIDPKGNRLKVHHKRVVEFLDDKSTVVESNGAFWSLCPKDGSMTKVDASVDKVTCSQCNLTHETHWIGVKPMQVVKQPKEVKEKAVKEKAVKEKPVKEKPQKVVVKPAILDVSELKKLTNIEVWVKNTAFGSATMDVKSYVLLFTGDNPRKLCFNTYDGSLGKKITELPIKEFIADGPMAKLRWYPVKNLEVERVHLKTEYTKL